MCYVRRAAERGHARFDWLDSKHTFSFGNYYDPQHMGFSTLRVINDDTVAPGGGFAPHGHRDMEIISVVLSGGLAHQDSMGNGSTIVSGDVQRMSAGTGVRHSEFNASNSEPVHFLQIWIVPQQEGLAPGYEQKNFPREDRLGRMLLAVSHGGRDGSLSVHQDMNMYLSVLASGDVLEHNVTEPRQVWVHVASGELTVDGERLAAGDGLGVTGAESLSIEAQAESEFLLFELERVS